jgi:hypothetical protein
MKSVEHPEPVEGCGFGEPSSFDRLRMTILVLGLSSNVGLMTQKNEIRKEEPT